MDFHRTAPLLCPPDNAKSLGLALRSKHLVARQLDAPCSPGYGVSARCSQIYLMSQYAGLSSLLEMYTCVTLSSFQRNVTLMNREEATQQILASENKHQVQISIPYQERLGLCLMGAADMLVRRNVSANAPDEYKHKALLLGFLWQPIPDWNLPEYHLKMHMLSRCPFYWTRLGKAMAAIAEAQPQTSPDPGRVASTSSS